MSADLIIAQSTADLASDGTAVNAEQLTRAQRKALEKAEREQARQSRIAITRADFPVLFAQFFAAGAGRSVFPHLQRLGTTLNEMLVSVQALSSLLIEKGILTQDEVEAREQVLVEQFNKALEAAQAEQEAAKAAKAAAQAEQPAAETPSAITVVSK